MRNYFKILIVGVLLVAFNSVAADNSSVVKDDGPVRHVVVFKYKPSATEAEIQQVTDAFRELKNKIPGILSFETGVNNSPENLDQDFSHVYLVTFENAKARDTYLPHPQHGKFGDLLGKLDILDGVFVVDYVVQP